MSGRLDTDREAEMARWVKQRQDEIAAGLYNADGEYLGPSQPMTWAQFGRQAREHGSTLLAKFRREYRQNYLTRKAVLVPREAEVIAWNPQAGRLTSEPLFLAASRITGKALRSFVASETESLRGNGHTNIRFSIAFGYNLFDSLQDQMQGGDYTPMVELAELDIPVELSASC
jgi:hypothetical protein